MRASHSFLCDLCLSVVNLFLFLPQTTDPMTLSDSSLIPCPSSMPDYMRRGTLLLDSAMETLRRGSVAIGMDEIVLGSKQLRDEDETLWRTFVAEQCRAHPIASLLQEDPFTRRSLEKPRGYTGDPEMFEFIFSPHRRAATLDEMAREIFHYTTDGPAPRSVRARAAMTARLVDTLAEKKPLRALGIMSGHLWEAGMSSATRSGRVEKYVAFDGDPRALATIDAAGYGPGLTTYQGSIRSIIRGRSVFRNFDFVYSGLCDNLSDPMADHFIAGLVEALAPGGTLLLSNFAPSLVDIGYMEAFMDWNLNYRDEAQLLDLVESAAAGRLESMRTYRDPHGNIVFVEAVGR